MKTLLRLPVALSVALGGLAALAGPASAAPPTITSVTPAQVAADGFATITGTGCTASSPVSFYLWDTTGGTPPTVLNTAMTADGAGSFTHVYALANVWEPGDEVGVTASCTAIYEATESSTPRFLQVTLADPYVAISAPTRATYGVARVATVLTDAVPGTTVLTIDGGAPLTHLPGSYVGAVRYRIPAGLAVGSHRLRATWDPTAAGAPTVTTDRTITITRANPVLSIRTNSRTVRRTAPLRIRVILAVTGVAPRTGVVQIKDGTRVVQRVTLRAADRGARWVTVRLDRTGKRALRAFYLGNARTLPKRSTPIHVQVRR